MRKVLRNDRMTVYLNRNGNSGVVAYALGVDYIDIQFKTGRRRTYRYSYASAGASKVETMKQLAERGYGLNAYIQRYAREDYVK